MASFRYISWGLPILSRCKLYPSIGRICTRNMVKHTRAVVPTIKDEKAAKAFVIHLDENARNLLKDQIIQMEKLDELERQLEKLEKSVVATVGEYRI